MRLARSRFLRACLAGALVAAPLGALVQATMDWEILHVDTGTHWAVDAGVYAVCIAAMALLAGALGLPLAWLARRVTPRWGDAVATLASAALGLALFARMVTWHLPPAELAKLAAVLLAFYAVFFAGRRSGELARTRRAAAGSPSARAS